MMKYLEGEELTNSEIDNAIKVGTQTGEVVPILCGSALSCMGVELLLDHITQCMPSPVGRKIQGVNAANDEEVTVSTDTPQLNALVFKTMADPYVGKLTLFRVFSGTIKSDSSVYNVRVGKEERIGQLFVVKGKEQIAVSQIGPGDLGAVAKLRKLQPTIH